MSKVSRSKLARYIAGSDEASDKLVQSVAALLIDNGQTSELESLMRDVSEMQAENQGIVELTVVSAFPLSDSSKIDIEELVKKHYPNTTRVIINQEIDKTVLGGVNLKFANASLDMTLRSKLNKLREATV